MIQCRKKHMAWNNQKSCYERGGHGVEFQKIEYVFVSVPFKYWG